MTASQEEPKIVIAIDGYSSCGKSTLAKGLAKRLHYIHVDSGAMYRAVTLYFLRHQISMDDPQAIKKALENISIRLGFDSESQITWLNNENVDKAIRDQTINELVSEIATLSAVRKAMVAQQRKMGESKGLVMDGRDIGTVVFPNAELKLFLVADLEVRVERRWLELQMKGLEIDRDDVRKNLLLRDHIDSTRTDSPLRKAADAVILDTSYLTEKEQLQISYDLARLAISRAGVVG